MLNTYPVACTGLFRRAAPCDDDAIAKAEAQNHSCQSKRERDTQLTEHTSII